MYEPAAEAASCNAMHMGGGGWEKVNDLSERAKQHFLLDFPFICLGSCSLDGRES